MFPEVKDPEWFNLEDISKQSESTVATNSYPDQVNDQGFIQRG